MLQRIFLAVLLTTAGAIAQTVTGTVSGSVVDNSGAVLVAAEVKLTNDTTGVARTAQTNETGTFVFAAVPPGGYSLAVEVKGFRPVRHTGIAVTANERLALGTIELQVGQLAESVEVVAQSATVNVESAENTAMLTSKQMDTMMARGRDVANLLRILPGVAQNSEGPAVARRAVRHGAAEYRGHAIHMDDDDARRAGGQRSAYRRHVQRRHQHRCDLRSEGRAEYLFGRVWTKQRSDDQSGDEVRRT